MTIYIKTMKNVLLALTFAILSVSTVQAQVWSNAITDAAPNTYNPYTIGDVVASNLTVSGIGRGPGISGNAAGSRYNATSWSLAGMDTSDYFTFMLTPDNGFSLQLTSLAYNGQKSGTGPGTFALRSSLDGFTANIGSPAITGNLIDLSAPEYQEITGSIEFRLYAWGGTAAAGTYSVNDFVFEGIVNAAVPEPATATLLGFGLLGLGTRRKRGGVRGAAV
jgi:hypothetical protein